MITTLTDALKGILGLNKKISEKEIECAIDEQTVDCAVMEEEPAYTGVPAPAVLQDDPWFGPAPVRSQKQLDYMEQETFIKQQQHQETHSVESEDIHQKMYDIATQNWNTVKESQGGSENFQEGPGGWNSGNGMGQFVK